MLGPKAKIEWEFDRVRTPAYDMSIGLGWSNHEWGQVTQSPISTNPDLPSSNLVSVLRSRLKALFFDALRNIFMWITSVPGA